MNNSEFNPDKLFTVEDANKCLPLVRAIVRDISSLSLQVQERRQRLSQLAREEASSANDPYAEETEQIRSQLESDIRELERFENELAELGVECKHGPEGIVDFPCILEGRLVYLCWKLGESEVETWHEADAGYKDRHPLTAGSAADGPSDDMFDA